MNKYCHFTSAPLNNKRSRSLSRQVIKNESNTSIGPFGVLYQEEPKEKPILYPNRPNTASISSLALQENLKKTLIIKPEDNLAKSLKVIKNIPSLNQFLTTKNKDFAGMIKRLDRISRNINYGQKNLDLEPSEPLEVELIAKESQIVLVSTKRKPCPLHIYIDRAYGKLEIYASRKIKEPSSLVHDFSFKTDYFRISEKSLFFLYP